MQTWARRGLQTALITGGLLMLGTGIASADEDVNPDRPASPLDGSVRVPVHLDNNALGTPLGQKNLPVIDKEVRVDTGALTGAVPAVGKAAPVDLPAQSTVDSTMDELSGTAAPVVGTASHTVDPTLATVHRQAQPALDKAKPLADEVNATTAKAGMPPLPAIPTMSTPRMDGVFTGNRVDGDLVVPVDVSGNAIALLGAASVENESYQSYSDSESVVSDGSGGFIAGNVVDLDWALPVQITGNAIAGLGRAESTSTASQDTSVTSDVTSDGSGGVLSGNVLAGHWATPVQLTGNALAGGGKAQSDSTADTTATSGGTVLTSGADSLGSGNIGAPPIATPVEGNGNAIAGAGKTDASSETTATATAGSLRDGLYGVPTYLETNGDPAVAAGNVVEPAVSGPALACGNAGAAAGGSTADCTSDSTTTAGGTTRSTGEGSILSGAAATAPVATPAEGFGNSAAGVGAADSVANNTVTPTAGGDSYTRGHDGLASGTVASAAPAGPVDVFSNAAAGAGAASSTATQNAATSAGGHTGTTGDDSLGGGNTASVPVNTPVEGFGNVAAGAGGAQASATETKTTEASSGGGNTDDDGGVLAANNVTAPVAGAAQAFGNGGGVVAFTDADATTDNDIAAGGDTQATGTGGLGSGNIGQAPVSIPAQVFGTGASGLAGGHQTAANNTSMHAGGDAMSDGQHGVASGNVASGPVGSTGQAFGESAAALGLNDSSASSTTDSVAGGTVETDGSSGLGTGNVVSPQALPVAQSFAAVASGVGGGNSSQADSTSAVQSGGDIDTAGDQGFLAGNLVDVPGAAVAQPFGDAVSAVESHSESYGDNVSDNAAGGTSTTSGTLGSLSGIDGTVPVGAHAPVYDVPVAVVAQAVTQSTDLSTLLVGEGDALFDAPVSGGMSPTELPTIHPGRSARDLSPTGDITPFAGVFSGVLDGFADGMTGVPGQHQVRQAVGAVPVLPGSRSDVPGPLGDLPLSGTPLSEVPLEELPVSDELAELSQGGLPAGELPTGQLPALPAAAQLPAVGELPALPDAGQLPAVGELPAGSDLGDLPTGQLPAVPADLSDTTAVLPVIPAADDLANVSTQRPAVPALPQVASPAAELPALGDADVTQVVPTIPSAGEVPALPAVGDVPSVGQLPVAPAVPAVPAPSVNTMPVELPALSEMDAAPGMNDASLSATRAALANLFAVHPIA
jgi:trimeric autotransporter adhesin